MGQSEHDRRQLILLTERVGSLEIGFRQLQDVLDEVMEILSEIRRRDGLSVIDLRREQKENDQSIT